MTRPSDQVISFYQKHVKTFDRERNRQLFEGGWLTRFSADLPNGSRIIDLGCGMAEPMAAHLIRQGYQITGIDSAPEMIARCKTRFPKQVWTIGDMRAFPIDRAFDGILAWDSFFHLSADDQKLMFPRFRELSNPGAPLLFNAGPRYGEATNLLWGDTLYHFSLSADEYRQLLNENGFALIDFRLEDTDCGGRSVFLAKRQAF